MLEVTVGPPHIAINQGRTIVVSELDGQIHRSSPKGLYFFDTRLVNDWRITANGTTWELLNGGNLYHYASRSFLTNPAIPVEKFTIPRHTLELAISRSIDGGMHEDLDLINYGQDTVEFNLEVLIHSDFADLFEVKAKRVIKHGLITSEWLPHEKSLHTVYQDKDFCREIAISVDSNGSMPLYANGRICFPIKLDPGQGWHTCLLYEPGDGKVRTKAPSQVSRRSSRRTSACASNIGSRRF